MGVTILTALVTVFVAIHVTGAGAKAGAEEEALCPVMASLWKQILNPSRPGLAHTFT